MKEGFLAALRLRSISRSVSWIKVLQNLGNPVFQSCFCRPWYCSYQDSLWQNSFRWQQRASPGSARTRHSTAPVFPFSSSFSSASLRRGWNICDCGISAPRPPHIFWGQQGRAFSASHHLLPRFSFLQPFPATACPTLRQKQRDVKADGLGERGWSDTRGRHKISRKG